MERMTEKISVRTLVEFIFRSGDLDNRKRTRADLDAMQKGSRLHRKIQGRMGSDYHAEVSLVHVIDCGAYDIRLRRMDRTGAARYLHPPLRRYP